MVAVFHGSGQEIDTQHYHSHILPIGSASQHLLCWATWKYRASRSGSGNYVAERVHLCLQQWLEWHSRVFHILGSGLERLLTLWDQTQLGQSARHGIPLPIRHHVLLRGQNLDCSGVRPRNLRNSSLVCHVDTRWSLVSRPVRLCEEIPPSDGLLARVYNNLSNNHRGSFLLGLLLHHCLRNGSCRCCPFIKHYLHAEFRDPRNLLAMLCQAEQSWIEYRELRARG